MLPWNNGEKVGAVLYQDRSLPPKVLTSLTWVLLESELPMRLTLPGACAKNLGDFPYFFSNAFFNFCNLLEK